MNRIKHGFVSDLEKKNFIDDVWHLKMNKPLIKVKILNKIE